ncbi:MAG: helix-hairpin-helix domain-containing protein [Nanoarchaeota archaeon]
MRLLVVLFLAIFLVNLVSSSCENNQIDINGASAKELDKIIWVGNSTAEKIIAERPFNSLDDLTKVSGIAEGKLADIKEQNLACVGSETKNSNNKTPDDKSEEQIIKNEVQENDLGNLEENIVEQPEIREVIQLNSETKGIKDTNSEENSNNYPYYGLAGFAVLLGFLFYLKKRKYKNEFDDK